MILYTPMQLELVTEGIEKMCHPDIDEIFLDGVKAVVEYAGSGRVKVLKLLSTNPRDFLNPKFLPGNIVNI